MPKNFSNVLAAKTFLKSVEIVYFDMKPRLICRHILPKKAPKLISCRSNS